MSTAFWQSRDQGYFNEYPRPGGKAETDRLVRFVRAAGEFRPMPNGGKIGMASLFHETTAYGRLMI